MIWIGLGHDTALLTDERQNHRCHRARRNKMNLRLGSSNMGTVEYCVQREKEGRREKERKGGKGEM